MTRKLIDGSDYLQHLADESKIKVEKIGSGNWYVTTVEFLHYADIHIFYRYWSFASEEKKIQEKLLTDAQSAHEKLDAIVADLKQKVADVQAQHEDDAEMLHSGVESRESLMAKQHALTKEVQALQKQLAAYSDSDPAELERKKVETKRAKAEFEQYTDEIYAMESWIQQHAGPEAVKILRAIFYGDEYDEEEGALRELA